MSGSALQGSTAAGMLTLLDGPAYALSKHGAVAFGEWLSATYRHRGVVVQALCPQGVSTRMLDQTGGVQDLLSRDRALTPEEVARTVVEALADDRFYVLPHEQVAGYSASRSADPGRWLGSMNRLQQSLEDAGALSGPS